MDVGLDRARTRAPRRLLLSGCAFAAAALPLSPTAAQELATPLAVEERGADAMTLDTIAVTTTAGGVTEGTGSYVAEGVAPSATGLPLTPHELPQSVSIITNQEITDQNFQTLNEVIDYMPGLFAAQGNGEMRWGYSISTPATSSRRTTWRSMIASKSCAARPACWRAPATPRRASTSSASGRSTSARSLRRPPPRPSALRR